MRQRYLARRLHVLFTACLEPLEKRSMLHAGHDHVHDQGAVSINDINPLAPTGEHIPASMVLEAFPALVGRDLWAPETFNPTGSENRADWLYDPHFVEDDITNADKFFPDVQSAGPEAGPTTYPDLVPLRTGGYLSPYIDSTEITGHNLLRFSTAVGNMGAGPATLISANSGTPPVGSGISSWINTDGTQNVLQQIFSYDGTSYSFASYRPAGKMVWHSGHSHFHLEGYANYRLLTNVGGNPGPVAKRTGFDGADAVGDKIGFCLINILSSFTLPGTSTSSSTLPGFNKAGQPSTGCGFLQGISVGKADVYDSIYDGQWIDVTGVPNGNYFLEVTLDAQNVIQESNEANNTVLVPVTLNTSNATGGTILPDRFEPNNTFETATELGVRGVETQPGLTAHVSNESDYFRFEAASSGPGSIQLVISNRDVNLYLYDSNEVLLASSTLDSNATSGSPATETINYNFVAGQTYYVRAHGFGTAGGTGGISSNYSLKLNILPTITSSATDAIALESSLESGTFRIDRNGPTSSPLTVNITVGGTATRGVDYQIFQDGVPITGNSLSIGNEAAFIDLQVVPLADSFIEANETVTLTLGSGSYAIGSGGVASIVIRDVPPMAIANQFAFETAQTLSFDFSLDVGASLQPGDLVLLNTTTGQSIAATTAQYDAPNNRATFGFGAVLPDGDYQATIPSAALTHSQGVELGADATASFFVLAGDLNRDRTVNFDDLLVLAQNYGTSGRTFSQGNVNYDGTGNVDFDDLLLLAQRYGVTLQTAAATTPRLGTKRRGSDVLS